MIPTSENNEPHLVSISKWLAFESSCEVLSCGIEGIFSLWTKGKQNKLEFSFVSKSPTVHRYNVAHTSHRYH